MPLTLLRTGIMGTNDININGLRLPGLQKQLGETDGSALHIFYNNTGEFAVPTWPKTSIAVLLLSCVNMAEYVQIKH